MDVDTPAASPGKQDDVAEGGRSRLAPSKPHRHEPPSNKAASFATGPPNRRRTYVAI